MLAYILKTLKGVTIGGEANGSTHESDSEEEIERKQIPMGFCGASMRNGGKDSENNGVDPEDNEETIQRDGFITALDRESGTGVIDRLYTFKASTQSTAFQRGDKVHFTVTRSRRQPRGEVISMKPYHTDKEKTKKERCQYMNVIAKVVSVNHQFTEIELVVPHSVKNSTVIHLPNGPQFNVGFSWLPGDWMQLCVINVGSETTNDEMLSSLSVSRISSISPAQRKTVVGKVTKRNQNILIDDSIYYAQDSCKNLLPVGTVVKCQAISSDQSIGPDEKDYVKWRAVKVQKSNFLNYAGYNGEADHDRDWLVGKEVLNRYQELLDDKCGIQITPKHLSFAPLVIGTSAVKPLTVLNTSQHSYRLEKIRFDQGQPSCQFDIQCSEQLPDGSVILLPNDEVIFDIRCTPIVIGKTTEVGVFDFGNFTIACTFIVIGRAKEEESLMIDRDSSRPNIRKPTGDQDISRFIADRTRKCIKGSQAFRAPFFSQKRLPVHKVPFELFQILKDQDEQRLASMYRDVLKPVMYGNYKRKFQVGLWFEEIENDLRRRQYDLHGVQLEKCSSDPVFYKFEAPGIQDFIPPVNLQDTIDAFDVKSVTNTKFQGSIMKIIDTEVICCFGEAFDQQYTGFPLTIQFNLGRTNYKRCHFAVQTAVEFLGEEVLFPPEAIAVKAPRIQVYEDDDPDYVDDGIMDEGIDLPTESGNIRKPLFPSLRKHTPTIMSGDVNGAAANESSLESIGRRARSLRFHFVSDTASAPSSNTAHLKWFNSALNEEQKNAVRHILRGQARPVPYIIYGPPGTGKTVTLVEAVMQVNKLDLNSRILVCAPSNAAADVIAEHLANSNRYQPGEFIRLNGFMRSGQTMLESIAPYCSDGEDLHQVAMNRLIVSTCVTAGQFFSLDLTIGHFTHVFIDEAGYCTEPETMVPSTLLALSKGGQLILAGDPNQLGPVLMSDVAENIGLDVSFLERLMNLPLYRRDEECFPVEKYNPLVLTKLVKNYRAHPALLRLPSRLFYDNELESRATLEDTLALCRDRRMKNVLVSEGVPLILHGVQGVCIREGESTSSCNKAEACQVVHYVATLLEECGLCCEDIGIITPYRKQVEKIRMALQMNLVLKDNELPKVASVEEFQGGERKVIIISTVRSANENRIDSQLERLGFLYQPKRFNVAITRAKALMIVIGNPFVLSKNPFWLQLLRYALDLNAYKGCNLPIHLSRQVRRLVQLETDDEPQNDEENGSNFVHEFEPNVYNCPS